MSLIRDNLDLEKPHVFSDLIWSKHNALTKEFCDHCIQKFEEDPNKYQGLTGDGVRLNTKQSIDLALSGVDSWKDEDRIFFKSLNESAKEYVSKISDMFGIDGAAKAFRDCGYQIQKTVPGGFYKWHNDFSCTNEDRAPRYLTFIWYLNDVHEDGYTEFIDGTRIQPEAGKLIIFPATWTYMHRGYPPKSENKYICTGWLHTLNVP
jgi:hypothetical protein